MVTFNDDDLDVFLDYLPEKEEGNFKIDYDEKGWYALFQSDDEYDELPAKIVKRSKKVCTLLKHIKKIAGGQATVEMSDLTEIIYSLEVSKGKEVWSDDLDL